MKTIFLFIPNYIFASDLLRTDYIRYLSEKYRVLVFTPMIDEVKAIERNYFTSPNVSYIERKLENPNFFSRMQILRIFCTREFDYLSSIRHYYKRDAFRKARLGKLLRLISYPLSPFLTADFFTKLELGFIPASDSFLAFIKEYRPDLIVTATPGLSEFEAEAVLLAKKTGIPVLAADFTWDNLTMNAKHIRKPDFLFAWNAVIKKEAEEIHNYQPGSVFITGIMRFDYYFQEESNNLSRDDFLLSKGLNPKYKTILYTTVTKAYPFQKKYIYDLLEFRKRGRIPYVNIFIRVHPRDIYENYSEFLGIPDLAVEKAGQEVLNERNERRIEMNKEDILNLKRLLKYSDLNINYASTISIESFIFDKPVINIGWLGIYRLAYDFVHYRPLIEKGAVKLVKEDDDLPEYINMYLESPALDKENRQKVVKEYVGFSDGLSCKRNVDFLDKIIK